MTTNDTSLLLRMSSELKAQLQRAAFVNKRTVTAEIQIRLQTSLLAEQSTGAPAGTTNPYTQPNTPTVVPINDHGPAGALADTDRAMLEIFRKMPVEKQLALLSLFR